ncbi:hypothetical protein BDZ89DRAFT_1163861 [Hymenopellis radicata]|nr:hypothetical protein BDZ89DRAFT_1163861 [Hymenopellis radicata]
MATDPYCTSSFLLDTYRHELSVPTSKPTIKKRRKATKPSKQQKSQSDNMPVHRVHQDPPVDTTPVTVAASALAPPVREAALSLADEALKVAEPDVENAGSWVAAAPIPGVQVIEKRKRTLSDLNGPEEALKKARHDEGLEAQGKEREILGAEGILAQIPASAAAVDLTELDEPSSWTKENWSGENYALDSASDPWGEFDLSGDFPFAFLTTPESEVFVPSFGGESLENDDED